MSKARQTTPEFRTRRAFATLGAGAVAAASGWWWLQTRPEEDGAPWPLRRVLGFNEKISRALFSDAHRAPTFDPGDAEPKLRVNGDIGLSAGFDPLKWTLSLQGLSARRTLTLPDIQALPRVEQTTQLNCIEGWTSIVHWTGCRFADFTRAFTPESAQARYVRMETPDQEYFVGLDTPSALHPQTLLCYEVNGQPLPPANGAPLRLVIPVKYGIKNIKRIGTILFTNDRPSDYWADEGYDWYAGL